jgi:hypothetical protein
MSDATKRLESWQAKYSPELTKATLDARFAAMSRRYEAAVTALCSMETQVKQVLDAAGAHTILYVSYLDYARQLYKLSRGREISGESFALAAEVLRQKWAARGLDSDLLGRIRTQVFDIHEPHP